MRAWLRVAALGWVLALALSAAGPAPAWVPLAQAPAADRALWQARQPELRRLLDDYNYPAPGAAWQVSVLAAPALEKHAAFEFLATGAALVVVLARSGPGAVLFPLRQGGVEQPHAADNLHNLAAFNSVLAIEAAPAAGGVGEIARAQLYLACTGVAPPFPAAQELPAPRPGLTLVELRPWQFTFDAHGLLVGFRRQPFAGAGER